MIRAACGGGGSNSGSSGGGSSGGGTLSKAELIQQADKACLGSSEKVAGLGKVPTTDAAAFAVGEITADLEHDFAIAVVEAGGGATLLILWLELEPGRKHLFHEQTRSDRLECIVHSFGNE